MKELAGLINTEIEHLHALSLISCSLLPLLSCDLIVNHSRDLTSHVTSRAFIHSFDLNISRWHFHTHFIRTFINTFWNLEWKTLFHCSLDMVQVYLHIYKTN